MERAVPLLRVLDAVFELVLVSGIVEVSERRGDRDPVVAGLRTVLFTDIVGHTEMMSRLGGERSLKGVGEPVRVWAVREME